MRDGGSVGRTIEGVEQLLIYSRLTQHVLVLLAFHKATALGC